jgi:SAM-dependent methyltransferase
MPTETTIVEAYALPPDDYVRFFKCEGFELTAYQRSTHAWQLRNARGYVRRLNQVRPQKGRLLELGCSSGVLLEVAQEDGWDTAGVDPSGLSSRGEEVDLRLNIQRTTLFDAKLEEASFDFVFAASVVEHLTDPARYLRRLNVLLKPGGGLLIVALPNVRSFTIRLGADCWIGNHPPGHLQFFSRDTIRLLLRRTGFEPERLTVYGMPETVLKFIFGKAAIAGAAPSPSELLERPGLPSRLLGAARRVTYGAFDFFGIGSVMDVHAVKPRRGQPGA